MSELQSMLADTAARVFPVTTESPEPGFDATTWRRVADAGLDKVLLPEAQGGAGDAFAEAAAIAFAAGRGAAGVPIVETLVANWALAAAGLPLGEGAKALVVAQPGGSGAEATLSYDPSSSKLSWHGLLPVIWQPAATTTIVIAPASGGALYVARLSRMPDLTVTATIDGTPLALIQCPSGGIAVDRDAVTPLSRAPDHALALLACLTAAMMAGAMQQIVAMTVEYANTRKQFGRAIGAFQAVQQMAARLAAEAAVSAASSEWAASHLDTDNPAWAAGVAKARASEAAGKAAAIAHQIHGAIGFTREHALHRYTTRLLAWRDRAGSEAYWHDRIGRAAIDSGGAKLWPGIVTGLPI